MLEELRAKILLYEIANQPIPFRLFAYKTIIASYKYIEINMKDYSVAASLIANVFYGQLKDKGWSA